MHTKFFVFVLSVLIPSIAYGDSNYYDGLDTIRPTPSVLSVSGTYTETTTGATVERLSSITTLTPDNPTDAMIVYSRYSATNSNGQYLLVHGIDSASAWVLRLSDNTILHKVNPGSNVGATNDEIGENHEIRWDYSGSYPNRIYFVYGTKFYQMDVIDGNDTSTELYNVTADYPTASRIINDVEGDSSADSRYWAWQVLGAYDGANYPRIAFVVYDKTTDALIGQLEPGDVTPTQNAASWTNKFPKPNMVEISPNGDRIMLNYGRAYTGSVTQDFAGTVFDGPHVFNLDFTNPVKVGITETHSGWGFKNGKQLFIHHMNRVQGSTEDTLQACYTDGTGGTYPDNCFNILEFAEFNYIGQHLVRMPASKPGWIFMSSYAKDYPGIERSTVYSASTFVSYTNGYQYKTEGGGTTASSAPIFPTTTGGTVVDGTVTWTCRGRVAYNNQILAIELDDMANSPTIWRVSPTYNEYTGGYRDEGSAALSQDGNSIYWTSNWNDEATGHGEVYSIDITGWAAHFGIGGKTPAGISPSGTSISSSATGTAISILE